MKDYAWLWVTILVYFGIVADKVTVVTLRIEDRFGGTRRRKIIQEGPDFLTPSRTPRGIFNPSFCFQLAGEK